VEDLEEMVGCEAFRICRQAIPFGHIRKGNCEQLPFIREKLESPGAGTWVLDKLMISGYNGSCL
jgi:hypothetical protein